MLRLSIALLALLPACLKDETVSGYADPAAVYRLQRLNDAAFGAAASIAFPEPGQVRGNGPCNGYSAQQTVPYPWIRIEALVATRRACPDLEAEARFFTALQSAQFVEASGPVLILSNDAGMQMVFRAAQD